MHLSGDLGALLGLASARAQLDVGVRSLWGPDVDVTRCEVVHLDRLMPRAQRSFPLEGTWSF